MMKSFLLVLASAVLLIVFSIAINSKSDQKLGHAVSDNSTPGCFYQDVKHVATFRFFCENETYQADMRLSQLRTCTNDSQSN